MKTYTKDELNEILRLHKLWLENDITGVRADLSSANLRSANLRYANLRSAVLRYADLSSANLRYADLRSADLSSADLRSADLSSADLSYASLDDKYIQISCIGSRKGMTTYNLTKDIIWCGCFTGTLREFEKRVKETHKNNKLHLAEYLGFIKYVKSLIKIHKSLEEL
jgi:hypothetical protein